MFSMERIGQTIMRHRKACGMTQMQLANQMGISFQAVSSWERGLSCPDLDKLSELSALFGISVDELLGNDTTKALDDLKTKPCADAEMLFDEKTGAIQSLLVPDFMGTSRFGRKYSEMLQLPWISILKIGGDVIVFESTL